MDITFCTGLMGAGKSEKLIDDYRKDKREKVAFIITLTDKTGEQGIIESRNGNKISAICLNKDEPKEVCEIIKFFMCMKNTDVIYIDESQFLSESLIARIMCFSEIYNVPIHFFGLDLTFTADYFKSSEFLLKVLPSKNIFRLYRQCEVPNCDELAQYNARIVDGKIVRSGKVFVPEKSSYMALCKDHYFA